ncbi:MAG: alpha/beta fold hydrolase [Geodermatophilaceae bacterium]
MRNVRGFDEQHTAEFEPLLDAMTTPTLLVWGEQDRWLPVEVSATIQSRLPDAERRLIPDAGHFSPEDQPGRWPRRSPTSAGPEPVDPRSAPRMQR